MAIFNFTQEAQNTDLAAIAGWTQVNGSVGEWIVGANQALSMISPAGENSCYVYDTGDSDHFNEITYYTGGNVSCFPCCIRMTDNDNFIGVRNNSDQIQLYRKQAGSFSNIGQVTQSVSAGDRIRLEANGNDVEVFYNDVSVIGPITESFNNTVTQAGVVGSASTVHDLLDVVEIASVSSASNSAPVVNDQTFSVADSASNGTVIGTVVATDSDGTVDSYAISGSTLAINSTTGQITLADNAGIVAGTPITATATVTDNGGGTDTATVTVNVTNSGLSFTCYDADSSNAAITSETLSHVRVLDPADLSEVATATSIATSSTGSAEIDTDSVTIGTDYLVIARRSNGDVCEPFSVTASDLAAS